MPVVNCKNVHLCYTVYGVNSWATITTKGAWDFLAGRPSPWSQYEYGPIKIMQKLLLNVSMSGQNNVTANSQNQPVCFSSVCVCFLESKAYL